MSDQAPSSRPLGRRDFIRAALAASAGGAALYAVGCGSDGGSAGDSTAVSTAGGTPAAAAYRPVLLTIEHVARQDSRFAVGLLNNEGKLVVDANVHLRFFTLTSDGSQGQLRGEGDAKFVELNIDGAHAHDSTTGETASDDAVSFYLVNTEFDVAGKWGVEINVTPDGGGAPGQVQVPFDVITDPLSPGIGDLAPMSQNDTVATNSDLESLCSRSPACPLHDKVIADVLQNGRPTVVQFSTPAFCATRFCGPVLEVLLAKVPEYQDRVDFVHIEVWQDFQLKQYRPAMAEWKLSTEPFTFFMDGEGRVVLRLESIFTEEEVSSALEQLVQI